MKPRFLFRDPMPAGAEVILSPGDSHHLTSVLRAREGEAVELFDGDGIVAEGIVVEAHKRHTRIRIDHAARVPWKRSRVSLVFGVPKSAAQDFIIHRACEIGVAELQPVITDHSLRPKNWNADRIERVLVEVCKQCQDPYLPIAREPVALRAALDDAGDKTLVVCDESVRLTDARLPDREIVLLVGPEGGWSDAERDLFAARSAVRLGLGRNRLRAETAAIAALVLAKSAIGEFLSNS